MKRKKTKLPPPVITKTDVTQAARDGMTLARAAEILSRRAAFVRQNMEILDDETTREYFEALTVAARELLRMCGAEM